MRGRPSPLVRLFVFETHNSASALDIYRLAMLKC